jgi:hypothetical protein
VNEIRYRNICIGCTLALRLELSVCLNDDEWPDSLLWASFTSNIYRIELSQDQELGANRHWIYVLHLNRYINGICESSFFCSVCLVASNRLEYLSGHLVYKNHFTPRLRFATWGRLIIKQLCVRQHTTLYQFKTESGCEEGAEDNIFIEKK